MNNLQNLIIQKANDITESFGYDFLYEKEEESTLCQIVIRNQVGEILTTMLSFQLNIDEEKGTVIFYHIQGEIKRIVVSLENIESIMEVLLFIQKRLEVNRKTR